MVSEKGGVGLGKLILLILGMLSIIYGILVQQVGSGTMFWLIWEAIGMFFLVWTFLLHKGFFEAHKGIKITFYSIVIVGIAVMIVFCSMITKGFYEKGEKNLDYIIVLGAQVRENGPSSVLKYRLNKAIDYLNENPDTICIVSGGQGANEPWPEADAMCEYLIERGIDKEKILVENQSLSTVENIRNSKKLMDEAYNGVGIVTNNFHVYRAVRMAEAQGLKNVCGIAAKSNHLYLPNNILRECLSIFKGLILNNM